MTPHRSDSSIMTHDELIEQAKAKSQRMLEMHWKYAGVAEAMEQLKSDGYTIVPPGEDNPETPEDTS